MKRRKPFRRRATLGVIGIACAALAAPLVLAAPGGTPGNFKLAPTSPETVSGDRVESVITGKLDDEPGIDLALINANQGIALLSGSPDGDFTEFDSKSFAADNKTALEITAADLDGVNGTDLAVSLGNGPSQVAIFLNDGTGAFTEPATSPEATDGVRITSADFDGDEDIDLATGGRVLLNDGTGDFTEGDSFAGADFIGDSLENTDLDDDGDRDLVWVRVNDDTARVSFNDGDGNFTDGQALTGGSDSEALGGIAVGRINRGPSPDIALGLFENGPGTGWSGRLPQRRRRRLLPLAPLARRQRALRRGRPHRRRGRRR